MNKAQDVDIDRREIEQKRFRIDTGVNIAHILTTIGMLVMFFSWGSGLNSMDAVHSAEIVNIKEDRLRARVELMAALQEINTAILRNLRRGARLVRVMSRAPSATKISKMGQPTKVALTIPASNRLSCRRSSDR